MTDDPVIEEYCRLLLEHGLGLPWKVTDRYDLEGLARESGDPEVMCAVTYGFIPVAGPRFCPVCGQEAPSSPDPIRCVPCGNRRTMVPPRRILVLPPVASVLRAVRDALTDQAGRGVTESLPIAFAIEHLAKTNGLEIGEKATKASRWLTGPWWPKDRHPMSGFMHVVRGPFDGDRKSREERRRGRKKGEAMVAWKKDLDAGKPDRWEKPILQLMRDGRPRTFNEIMLEITNGNYTADTAYTKDPDKALWSLVESKQLEHTTQEPVLFRRRKSAR